MGNKIARSTESTPLLHQEMRRELKEPPRSSRFSKAAFNERLLPIITKFLETAKLKKELIHHFKTQITDYNWTLEIYIFNGTARYRTNLQLADEFIIGNPIEDNPDLRAHINERIINLLEKNGIPYNKTKPSLEDDARIANYIITFFDRYFSSDNNRMEANFCVGVESIPLTCGRCSVLHLKLRNKELIITLLHPFGDQKYKLPILIPAIINSLLVKYKVKIVPEFSYFDDADDSEEKEDI